ncbi:MAG TPA: head GIN domain-containing protein [Pelobium sp.]|nr:head GIN domain-containing protein [Pelobium sp.]
MKKYFAIVMFLCGATSLVAQDNLTKDLGEFHEVKVYDGLSVTLIKANKNQAIISGKNASAVVLVNKNGKLKVRMNINEVFNGYTTYVTLYAKGMIDAIDANENSLITSEDTFSQIDLDLRAQEKAEIKLQLDVQRLEAKASSGGILNLKGIASNQVVDVNTGGQFNGKDVESSQTRAMVKAGGTADILAKDYAEAKVRVGGTINVYGNPKVLEKQTFIGGTINEK